MDTTWSLLMNIGIVGAGEFAEFAALAFLKIDGIQIVGVTDINEASGRRMALEVKGKFHKNISDLLADDSIDLVYIATPPYL
ncbi:MAG: Gfo/Idh/MocA family oxidoreductase, partial [Saprospiraceae bacterium]